MLLPMSLFFPLCLLVVPFSAESSSAVPSEGLTMPTDEEWAEMQREPAEGRMPELPPSFLTAPTEEEWAEWRRNAAQRKAPESALPDLPELPDLPDWPAA